MQVFTARTAASLIRRQRLSVLWFQLRQEIRSSRIRRKNRENPLILPNALYVETGSYCRDRCSDCYIPLGERKSQIKLDSETLASIVAQARILPLDYICIVGGEPLEEPAITINHRLVRKHPDTRFLLCTAGAPIDRLEKLLPLFRLPNLSTIVSLDGFQSTHDRRRGRGTHIRALASIEFLSRSTGNLCGASVTVDHDNHEEVTSEEFVHATRKLGCSFFSFNPVENSSARSPLTQDDFTRIRLRLAELSRRTPGQFFLTPHGQILGDRYPRPEPMRTLAIDYHGNIRTSRRGAVFGNILSQGIAEAVSRPDLQASYESEKLPGAQWACPFVC